MPTPVSSPSKKILKTMDMIKVAGYDLYSAEDVTIAAYGKGLVKTDLQIKVPRGTYRRVALRSVLAYKG